MNEYDTLDMLKERWMNMTHSTCSGKAWHTQHAQGTLDTLDMLKESLTHSTCSGKVWRYTMG